MLLAVGVLATVAAITVAGMPWPLRCVRSERASASHTTRRCCRRQHCEPRAEGLDLTSASRAAGGLRLRERSPPPTMHALAVHRRATTADGSVSVVSASRDGAMCTPDELVHARVDHRVLLCNDLRLFAIRPFSPSRAAPRRRQATAWLSLHHSGMAAGLGHATMALTTAGASVHEARLCLDPIKTMSIRTATGHAGARRSSTSSCGCCQPSALIRSTARWCSEQPLRRWRPCCHPTPASTLTALVPVRAHLAQRRLMVASGRRS